MIKRITFSLIASLVFIPFLFAVNGETVSDCDFKRFQIFEDCKVENCELYMRYGVVKGSSEDLVFSGLFGTFNSSDLEIDPGGVINYTEWILRSDIPLPSSSQTYYEQLFFSIIPFDTLICESFYTPTFEEISTCIGNAIKSTDTLYFEVDQNTTAELDLTPANNSCIDECLLDYSVDKLGSVVKGDGCLLNYTPGNDYCGEELLTFYYINDEGEVVSQCAVINVVCDPVEFEVYFDGICDVETLDYEPFFTAVGLNDGQIIEWRLCDSDEWTALDFEEIDSDFSSASPGLIWQHIDLPHCIQYRDPENPNAIVTRTFDGCTYLPVIAEDNLEVNAEFICNNGANLFRSIFTISPKIIPFGNIYWDYCECTGTLDEPLCQEWNLATQIGGEVRIELPLLPHEENLCIKIVDGNSPYAIERLEYGTGDIICQTPLAIDLLNFEGRKLINVNELVWHVATEQNNDYYILEKSEDGTHFSELAKIKSQRLGNQLMTYDYKDMNPNHINYYRLVSVDEMGNEEIVSDVIRIEQDKLIDLTVFPNPTKGEFGIEYKSDAIQDIQMEVFDLTGKLLVTETLKTSVGVNNYPLNINQYPNGSYLVKIVDRGVMFVRKVLKN